MSNEVMKSLSGALGMNPLLIDDKEKPAQEVIPVEESVTEELSQAEKDAEADFAEARKNLKDILDVGQDALENINRIAASSEAPRAYEVVATMIKNMTEANKDLLKLHEQRRILAPVVPEPEKETKPSVTNNNVFVGTTAELLDMIKKNKQKGIIEHE